jgi:SAM-dependent methyltransferase
MQLPTIVAFLFNIKMEKELECCVLQCDTPLDKTYWNNQYLSQNIGWDLGEVSPAIKKFIDTLTDKSLSILIPGCGNAYEAEYLLQLGFTNITIVDIAPDLVNNLQQKFDNYKQIKVVNNDFFELTGSFDLIIEQTFFCALPPKLRQLYAYKMYHLLSPNGRLIGLLFNRQFDKNPPFGGSILEYEQLFKIAFNFSTINICDNSVKPRANSEVFIDFAKNKNIEVNLLKFTGITCNGCKNTVTQKLSSINEVQNVSMSVDFKTVLIISNREIDIIELQNEIAYDPNYSIKKYK